MRTHEYYYRHSTADLGTAVRTIYFAWCQLYILFRQSTRTPRRRRHGKNSPTRVRVTAVIPYTTRYACMYAVCRVVIADCCETRRNDVCRHDRAACLQILGTRVCLCADIIIFTRWFSRAERRKITILRSSADSILDRRRRNFSIIFFFFLFAIFFNRLRSFFS